MIAATLLPHAVLHPAPAHAQGGVAIPNDIPNGRFDEANTPLFDGTFPANFDFATEALPLTGPANLDFANGISGWTPVTPPNPNPVKVVADGDALDRAYLFIDAANQAVTSSAFLVPPEAQSLHVDFATWNVGDATAPTGLSVSILIGATVQPTIIYPCGRTAAGLAEGRD